MIRIGYTEVEMAGILCVEIGVLTDLCLRNIMINDPGHRLWLNKGTYRFIYGYSILVGIWLALCQNRWGMGGQLACGVLAAYLLVSSITDFQTCEVYDFLHILGALAALAVFFQRPPTKDTLISLLVYWLLQHFLFSKMYGEADAMAFLVCALFESVYGFGLLTYLFHMGAAFIVLAIVQAVRHNINRHGNLKQPVPFLPYIALTVWIFL